jgi:hypothetical protein
VWVAVKGHGNRGVHEKMLPSKKQALGTSCYGRYREVVRRYTMECLLAGGRNRLM